MDARSILSDRIDLVSSSLHKAKKLLDHPEVDPALSGRVRGPLIIEIQENLDNLNQLRLEVEEGQALDACWHSFRNFSQQCERVFRECLAFIQGAFLRNAGTDNGLCQVADALLVYLSQKADISWNRFTMLGEGEFFVDMAQIIRLRFLDLSVWTLPIAAHEFGHFVGPEIKVKGADGKFRHPFEEMLEKEKQKGQKQFSYLHEHFADLFATYTIGPAFACACILLRFDPGAAYQDKASHPSDAKRLYLIFKMLEKMREEDKQGLMSAAYQPLINRLEEKWKESLAVQKGAPTLTEEETFSLDDLLEELFFLLKKRPEDLRYKSWLETEKLAAQLRPSNDLPVKVNDDITLPDVLNAAWLCRVQYWHEDVFVLRRIEERATDLCFRIAGIKR
jgi:hypothetical protein